MKFTQQLLKCRHPSSIQFYNTFYECYECLTPQDLGKHSACRMCSLQPSKHRDWAAIHFQAGAAMGFSVFATASRPALGTLHPPVQGVPGAERPGSWLLTSV